MIEATSCGGVVIFRGKILLLYKSYKNKYEGWVLPKGTVEAGEEYKDTAAREVLMLPLSSMSEKVSIHSMSRRTLFPRMYTGI